jgi:hypothetical protein
VLKKSTKWIPATGGEVKFGNGKETVVAQKGK